MIKKYSEIEEKDILERQQKVIDFLKENQLNPIARLSMQNDGKDVFGIKVHVELMDLKYKQDNELKLPEITEGEVKDK